MTCLLDCLVLAQTTSAPANPPGGGGGMMIGLILMIIVLYGMMFWGKRKDTAKKQQMLSAIKKNDRVMTIGGIIGTVQSVSDHEVVVKVDESQNVKITVIRSAIQKVFADGEKPQETP